jgi:hypothetical protein
MPDSKMRDWGRAAMAAEVRLSITTTTTTTIIIIIIIIIMAAEVCLHGNLAIWLF